MKLIPVVAVLAISCSLTLAYLIHGQGQGVRHSKAFRSLKLQAIVSPDQINDVILRKVDEWACVKSCGACCKLGPLDDRPELASYLSPEEYSQYVSMIGPDNWCKNFDKEKRLCTIYDTRPNFCRVDPMKFQDMYEIEAEEFSDFCTFCCREHITGVYGENSEEMNRFEDVIDELNGGVEDEEGEDGEESYTEILLDKGTADEEDEDK